MNLAFDFSVDKEKKTILVKRNFAADLPLVWDAFTKSEILDKWWAPRPWKARTKSMDFRPGGQWLYAMVGPNGEEHWSIARYKSIDPQKSFVGVDGFTDKDGNLNTSMPQSKWDVTFNKVSEGTGVTILLSYETLQQLEDIIKMGFKEGFASAMEGLDELIASGQLK